jgi:hypothetical protein
MYTSYNEMELCAEIAFLARQNAKNEYQQRHEKQVRTILSFRLDVFVLDISTYRW